MTTLSHKPQPLKKSTRIGRRQELSWWGKYYTTLLAKILYWDFVSHYVLTHAQPCKYPHRQEWESTSSPKLPFFLTQILPVIMHSVLAQSCRRSKHLCVVFLVFPSFWTCAAWVYKFLPSETSLSAHRCQSPWTSYFSLFCSSFWRSAWFFFFPTFIKYYPRQNKHDFVLLLVFGF